MVSSNEKRTGAMGKKKVELGFVEQMRLLGQAGLSGSPVVGHPEGPDIEELPSLDERVKAILGVVGKRERKATDVLFFVMYDIASNKVRRLVVKYLQKKGCHRVQKSIFLADLDAKVYEEIKNDLAEVQAAYENMDSILVVPLSTDYLRAMKVIGHSVNIDVITHSRNTLFF